MTKNFSFFQKLQIVFTKSRVQSKETQKAIALSGKDTAPKYLVRTLPIKPLQLCAAEQNASLNDLLLAAYVRALHDQFHWSTITLPCPVDLRRFVKTEQPGTACNLTGNYYCQIRMAENEPFETTLEKVSSQMRAQKADDTCLKGPILLHLLYPFIPCKILQKVFAKLSPVPLTSYTNMGKLDAVKLTFRGAAVTDAFFVTAAKPVPYFQLTISSFGERCTLSSCTCAGEKDLSVITELLDEICEQLRYIAQRFTPENRKLP